MTDAEREQFMGWLDTGVIAEMVFEQLEEEGVDMATVENAKIVWLDVLENLGELIVEAVLNNPAIKRSGE